MFAAVAWAAVAVPGAVGGGDPAQRPERPLERLWTVGLSVENDLFYDTDRDYTSGVRLSVISPDLDEDFDRAEEVPGVLVPIARRLPFLGNGSTRKNVVYSLGQNLYTPFHTSSTEFDPDDRPYAALLYFGFAFHSSTERQHDSLEINLGVVGPWALGEETQNLIHRIRDFPAANGWDHQIRNEPIINFVYERKWRQPVFQAGSWGAEVLAHGGGALGNLYTYANTGGGLRFGWNLPSDFGDGHIRPGGDANAPISADDVRVRRDGSVGIHTFITTDGRLMLRDITLDGNTFVRSHSVERAWWVADISGGVAAVWGLWKMSYAATYRTRTFEGGEPQTFGSINLGLTF